jgi:hypothetical protein
MSSGRKSTARMQAVQRTREQLIASLIVTGEMTNDELFDYFEIRNPSLVKPDDPKRSAGLVTEPYDAEGRAQLGRAIRSVRGLQKKSAQDNSELLEILGESETRSATEVDYENIRRFPSGDPVMDGVYGTTHFRWLMPDVLKRDEDGAVINFETGKKWTYGDLIPKKFLKHMNPTTGEYEPGFTNDNPPEYGTLFGDKTGYSETGLPVSFTDVWGGKEGLGKSRLALELAKSVCGMHPTEAVLYNYGESNMAQLRQWIGPKAPENLIIGTRKTLAQFMADIYRYRPIMTLQDSLQTLLDTRSSRGLSETVATLKQLATEEAANRTHIILISHLNKKGELKGTNDLGYLPDAIFKIFAPPMAKRGEFRWEVGKNRGGPSGAGSNYKHTDDGLICLGPGGKPNRLNLQQSQNPVIQQGLAG